VVPDIFARVRRATIMCAEDETTLGALV